jgi:DNA-binding MurR/RpiR family transcriptional regulator
MVATTLAVASVKMSRHQPMPRLSTDRLHQRGGEALGYGVPQTYEDLRAVLTSRTMRLPEQLRQVALCQHPSEMALGTASSVAAQSGVQPSTLVRFAQTLGYSGFSELQNVFKEYVKGSWPEQRERHAALENARLRNDPAFHLVNGFVQASMQSLTRVADTIDLARVATVVNILAKAEIIFLLGSKRAFPVTTYLSLALAQLGIANVLVDNVGSSAAAQISCTNARQAILAVSFSPYNSVTPELAAQAAQRGTPLAAITDSVLSPLVPIADAWIEVVESDYGGFRSIAATLAVGMAIVLGIARTNWHVQA